eukprot:Skav217535  [mRNA]  locus=scaffold467:43952:55097:+ [translate_table: standard]
MDRQLSAVLDLMLPGSGKQLSRENELLVAVQRDRRPGFFEALVSWAAYAGPSAKLARVVFVADSSFGEASILGHLKDRPEKLSVFQVQDVPAASVKRILQQNNVEDISEQQLRAIGGRYRDISAMLGHMRHGVPADEAVRWLLQTAEVTVRPGVPRRRLLLTGQPDARWTRPQLWRAIALLESSGWGHRPAALGETPVFPGDKVPYDVVLWNVFRGDESALRSMKDRLQVLVGEESNLIAVNPRKTENAPQLMALRYDVEAGSPLYAVVFHRLVRNEGLKAVLDLEPWNVLGTWRWAWVAGLGARLVGLVG